MQSLLFLSAVHPTFFEVTFCQDGIGILVDENHCHSPVCQQAVREVYRNRWRRACPTVLNVKMEMVKPTFRWNPGPDVVTLKVAGRRATLGFVGRLDSSGDGGIVFVAELDIVCGRPAIPVGL